MLNISYYTQAMIYYVLFTVQVVVYSEAAWMTAVTNGQWMMKWQLLSRHMLVWSISTSLLIFKAKEKQSKNSKFKIQSRVWQHTLHLVFSSTCCEIHTVNYIDKICASSGARLVAIGLTVLAWIQTKRSSLQHSCILADVPDVKVYKDRDGGKTSNSEPSQHEDVCQHDELQEKHRLHLWYITFVNLWRKLMWIIPFAPFLFISTLIMYSFACVLGYNKNTVGLGGSILAVVTNPWPFVLLSIL